MNPYIRQEDVDLLVAVIEGERITDLARKAGCTSPNIGRKVARAKERLSWEPGMTAEDVRKRAADMTASQQPVPRVITVEQALASLLAIVNESKGVAGYHLNGKVADWDEFPEVDEARAALDYLTNSPPIASLDLTVRTENCLRADGINTVFDLCRMDEMSLLKTPNMSKKGLLEIKDTLAAHGLSLGKK